MLVDLHALVTDVLAGAAPDAERAQLSFEIDLGATRSCVEGDPARLRQVLWNLLSNAIRNTSAGGRIVVRTYDTDDEVVLKVADTGRGIPRDMLERIFLPFDQVEPTERRARGGLGLGLAICRGLVEAHHGSITAWSDGPDRGATFTVCLPAVTSPPPKTIPRAGGRIASRRAPLRILLVEDDTDVANSMSAVLRLRGHVVMVAGSLQAALAHAEVPFDVVVSDIALPDGTGLELMRQLRKRGPVRGIAISGFGTTADVQRSLEAGFERHLTKPVQLSDLLEVVEPAAV